MTSEQERQAKLQQEIAELKRYKYTIAGCKDVIRTLDARLANKRYPLTPEERQADLSRKATVEQHEQKQWQELKEKYHIYEGVGVTAMEKYHGVTKSDPVYAPTTTGATMSYTGNPDLLHYTSLGNAIRGREEAMKLMAKVRSFEDRYTASGPTLPEGPEVGHHGRPDEASHGDTYTRLYRQAERYRKSGGKDSPGGPDDR
jgi:hypothetical protein